MGIGSFFKNTVKNNTNIKGWASWNTIKENGNTIGGFVKDIKGEENNGPAIKQTFEEAVKKYGLTEKDIAALMKKNLLIATFCAILAVGALGWAVYLFTKTMYLSGIVGIALSALMFSYAFREHFNYFQMKQRRLDCTFQEWLSSLFSNKK